MGVKEKGGYCDNCSKDVLIRSSTPNHILHLLLSIVTGGLWLIVWLLLIVKVKEWRCTNCGHIVSMSSKDIGSGRIFSDEFHYDGECIWVKGKENIKIIETEVVQHIPTGAKYSGEATYDPKVDLWRVKLK